MTIDFRNRMVYPKVVVETGMPQFVEALLPLSDKDLSDIWSEAKLSRGSRSIGHETSTYTIYKAFHIHGSNMFIGVEKSSNPSYQDIFFVGVYDYLVLPNLNGSTVYFYHMEKLRSVPGFSVLEFMIRLLSKYSLVSDVGQTNEGISLWNRLVAHALENGYNVYLFDTKKHSYTNVPNAEYVSRNSDKIWGGTHAYRNIRLLITKEMPK